jgi:hypothetical protein
MYNKLGLILFNTTVNIILNNKDLFTSDFISVFREFLFLLDIVTNKFLNFL